MTDPIERLRALDAGDPVVPSPIDVRRRGDRIRRRRHAVAGLAAAVAASVAVVVPSALLAGDDPTPAPAPPAPSGTRSPAPSETSSPAPSETGSPSVAEPIPADFPLVAGWPDPTAVEPGPSFGITGPAPDLEDPVFDQPACGGPLSVPGGTQRLRAVYRNVEDLRSRQLISFPSADDAVGFVDDVVRLYRSCPQEPPGDDGLTYTRVVVETEVGGQSWAVGRYPSRDGEPAVGSASTVHVVRLGSAVLVDTVEGEGGGAGDLEELARQRAGFMAQASASVVERMCLFTVAGC